MVRMCPRRLTPKLRIFRGSMGRWSARPGVSRRLLRSRAVFDAGYFCGPECTGDDVICCGVSGVAPRTLRTIEAVVAFGGDLFPAGTFVGNADITSQAECSGDTEILIREMCS